MLKSIQASIKLLGKRDATRFLAYTLGRVVAQFLDILGLAAVGLLGAYVASSLNGSQKLEILNLSLGPFSDWAIIGFVSTLTLLFVGKSIASAVLVKKTANFLAKVESNTAMEITNFIFRGDLSELKRYSRGEIQWAVGASTFHAFSGLLYSSAGIVAEGSLFLSVLVVMLLTNWQSALAVTAYFAVLLIAFQLSINYRLKTIGERLERNSAEASNAVLDLVGAFREISVYEKRSFFVQKFWASRSGQAFDQATHKYLLSLPRYFAESGLIIGVVGLIAWNLMNSDSTSGLLTVSVFLAGGVRMMAALLPLQNAFATIKTLIPQAERAQRLLLAARENRSDNRPRGRATVSGTPPLIYLQNISFKYPDEVYPTIKGLSLSVKPGEFAALIGPSGAGKTTIADLIMGLHEPDSGKILLDGLQPRKIRKSRPGFIGYVPQKPGLVSGSIAENIALGIDRELISEAGVLEALEGAQLDELVSHRPEGIWANLGKQSDELSGGQVQRIGLARALYFKPELLILDEATSALDAETESDIAKFVRALTPKVTLLVIAHRLSTIKQADTIYLIENGKVSASGDFPFLSQKVPLVKNYATLMGL